MWETSESQPRIGAVKSAAVVAETGDAQKTMTLQANSPKTEAGPQLRDAPVDQRD